MIDWSGKNGDESGKSQRISISCVSGNPVTICFMRSSVRMLIIV